MINEPKSKIALLKAEEVALMLSISTRTLWRLVSTNKFPEPVRTGGSTRWRTTDLENWIAGGCSDDSVDQQ